MDNSKNGKLLRYVRKLENKYGASPEGLSTWDCNDPNFVAMRKITNYMNLTDGSSKNTGVRRYNTLQRKKVDQYILEKKAINWPPAKIASEFNSSPKYRRLPRLDNRYVGQRERKLRKRKEKDQKNE